MPNCVPAVVFVNDWFAPSITGVAITLAPVVLVPTAYCLTTESPNAASAAEKQRGKPAVAAVFRQ